MNRNTLTTFDLLPEAIANLIAYGLSIGHGGVITVNADFKWEVRKE